MKKLHHFVAIVSLAAAGAAASAEYYVVVPVPNRTVQEAPAPVAPITVSLANYALPGATVGKAYTGFDFRSVLQVTGDAAYNPEGVSFTLSAGGLPQGMVLEPSTGQLTGTPQAEGAVSFDVTASYKGKSASNSYSLVASLNRVLNANGVRQWSDGTYAASCLAYRSGSTYYRYEGDVGTGIYRVQPAGQPATDVYCDMTADGGGWTLVLKGVAKTSTAAE